MDGRFLLKGDPHEGNDRCTLQTISEGDVDRILQTGGAAPTQFLPVVVERTAGKPERLRMHWGLVPRWPRATICPIEARSETMFERPMFRELARFRRCTIPMSGYFEWLPDENGKKRPYFITDRDGKQWRVAGLWDDTHPKGSDIPGSFAIVTMPANPVVARVHPRMPVILTRDHEADWLSAKTTDARAIRRLVQPYPETEILIYPASAALNNRRKHRPHPIAPAEKQLTLW